MSRKPPVVMDDENPEWTSSDFTRALRGSDIPAHIRQAFPKTRGRPRGSSKQLISLRIDTEIVERLRATGPGWQTRVNEILKAATHG
jgi:uncharacterized protein (DUF4415 family)